MPLPSVEPMKLSLVAGPFDSPDFLFELKHDGFRAVAYVENGQCRLVSRRRNTYKTFDSLRKSLAGLKAESAILDGEIVCLDSKGFSRFNELLRGRGDCENPAFYAFDLMWIDGKDMRRLPLLERKQALKRLLRKSGCTDILAAQFVQKRGTALFAEVCKLNLEGIVAKRKNSPYSATLGALLKIKNPNYTDAEGRREMFDAFRTRSSKSKR